MKGFITVTFQILLVVSLCFPDHLAASSDSDQDLYFGRTTTNELSPHNPTHRHLRAPESSLATDPRTVALKAKLHSGSQSLISWCPGNQHQLSGRCEPHALQAIIVGDSIDAFQLELRKALGARRFMTREEHFQVEEFLKMTSIPPQKRRAAKTFYSLYGFVQTTPGLITLDENAPSNLWLEMGVFTGTSCNLTAAAQRERTQSLQIHGFDTFTGLPKKWLHFRQGYFSLDGILPVVESNVQLHKGLFSDTLSPLLKQHQQDAIAGINIDCDLYEGSIETLNLTWPYWRKGTMLHFHELQEKDDRTNAPYTRQEESKALYEFLVSHPGVVLELLPIATGFPEPAVLFVVELPKPLSTSSS